MPEHSYPSWDEEPFDFSISDLSKIIKIQVKDKKRNIGIGKVLSKPPQDNLDFPSISEFLKIVGLLKDGKIHLMEKANVWLALNDAKTGKGTDQELQIQVAFRACGVYKPKCNALLVTNIPKIWAVAAQSESRFAKTLEYALYGKLSFSRDW